MKYLVIAPLIILCFCRFQCTSRCETHKTEDLGSLSQEALLLVPYTNADTIHFKHSQGEIFSFAVQRKSEKINNSFTESCNSYISEENTTHLIPDYPIFSCDLRIHQYDSINYNIDIYIGNNYFYIPNGNWDFDSLYLNNRKYNHVWGLQATNESYFKNSTITVDSLYYNTSNGILKITMTNGEYYELY